MKTLVISHQVCVYIFDKSFYVSSIGPNEYKMSRDCTGINRRRRMYKHNISIQHDGESNKTTARYFQLLGNLENLDT